MTRESSNNLVVFTDLDGTLLDEHDYRWAAAQPALDALARHRVPLVIVSSKTYSEVKPLLRALGRREPFVVENGGAIYFPRRYFPFRVEGAAPAAGGWWKVDLGTPRPGLVAALRTAARLAQVHVRSFSQMSAREVARLTNLRPREALGALRREYDEPFVILDHDTPAWPRLRAEIRRSGVKAARGGRFFHIFGRSDKGVAVRHLISWFRRMKGRSVRSVGLGDSANDVPQLQAVDVPILVARPGGRYDTETLGAVPHARRAGGAGPAGWNRAILRLLAHARSYS